MLKRAVSGEGTRLTKAEGSGRLYLADQGKKISILHLDGDTVFVNGNDILAFEPSIEWDVKLMRKIAGLLAGGLFNVRLEGRGLVAITTHYDPVTLRVNPQVPVSTDPNATVAWSGGLTPEFKVDVSLKSFLGRGSGESVQMCFQGDGFVVVQPQEEVYLQTARDPEGHELLCPRPPISGRSLLPGGSGRARIGCRSWIAVRGHDPSRHCASSTRPMPRSRPLRGVSCNTIATTICFIARRHLPG